MVSQLLEDTDFKKLPLSMRRYLKKTQVIGHEEIKSVQLKQRGLFNINGKKWTKMTANQNFNVSIQEFVWQAKAGFFSVVDQYVKGKGRLRVKLFGFLKIAEVSGQEMDQGEALRYLTESIWFPTAFISNDIEWKAITDSIAEATISYGDNHSASAQFHFGRDDLITTITAKRYREVKGKFVLADWRIDNLEYKTFNELLIPYKAHVSWMLEEGEFCYYKLELTELNYSY